MNRRIIVLLVIVLLVMLGLAGFYFYLAGGTGGKKAPASKAAAGIIHVRTVYTADGENLRRPTGLGAADNGDFYVTLKDDARVIGFDRRGDFKAKWGSSGIKQGQMLSPLGVAVNRLAGQVYVVDRSRLRIICFNTNGDFQWEQPLLNPIGITLLGDDLVVTTFGPIVRLSAEGQTVSETGSRGFENGQFDYPRAAARIPGTQDIVVADSNNTRIQRVRLSGEVTATAKWVVGRPPRFQDDPDTLFGVPSGITVDEKKRVFVLDGFRYTITALDPDTGKVLHKFEDLEGDGPARFSLPTGIVHLYDDYFAVTDTFNDRVQIVRLLLPEEDTFVARRPWLRYLLLLLLLPLLLPLLRRRVFVTREALEAAREDENLRLLAGAFKRLRVLPEVRAAFAETEEQGIMIADYLVAVGDEGASDGPGELERLAKVATPAWWKRLLTPRRLIICAGVEQAQAMDGIVKARVRDYAWVLEEYRVG